ncbi:NADH dehydrogenase 1 alpha subcomplex assembly factor 3 [Immersiella caudata]|uniref:Mth938 domain-containing protein n=1 Tax=Immersiella caudata TaxID=314043 RepID=A0AA39WT02_9PEZI|nr:NADH dehydrogenase 1 alpha subcomplex assembly factor 3 [Immersiella caudata]
MATTPLSNEGAGRKTEDGDGPPSVASPHAKNAKPSDLTSPLITSISWGRIKVHGIIEELKDAKVWPGGGRAWDWGETGTRHNPGIQLADVEELLEHGAQVVVLSRGMDERLRVADSVVKAIESRGVKVHVAETQAAVAIYNELGKEGIAVGALFHSTC